jgi:aminopeptidase N
MGAMENTSLNIFNTALVLAHKDTATDIDFERVEGVIAHEYFHNWTGNRITCRDWFQLSLKEGFTVFRDQQFSADMNSESVKRIDDVQALRRYQFPEDAGPLAHPIRPDNYIEINNFYTMTVYEKGAEVIRMQHTLLGEDKFRAATDFYFKEYDGQAITCDDFVECMQSQTDMDLTQFKLWYSQAGTPEVIASSEYDETDKIFKLTLEQVIPPTPGQPEKEAMHMPIKVGLVGPNGEDMVSRTLHLKKDKEEFIFENISSRPVPSILRDFSAPVNLKLDLSDEDLRFLMVNDNDGFNRWEAGQFYALRVMNEMIDFHEKGQSFPVDTDFLSSFTELLHSALHPETDKALLARSLTLPDIPIIAQNRRHVDPSVIYEVRNNIIKALIKFNRELFERIYEDNIEIEFSNSFESRSQRALKNVLLRYLLINKDDSSIRLAKTQYDSAHNMTDRLMAASVLSDTTSKEREEVLEDFYNRFKDYQLVIDKWFSIQAMALRPEVLDDILQLENHHDFNFSNPNRVRSLFGAFAMNNPVWFHSPDSRGYDFLKEGIIKLNTKNPQICPLINTYERMEKIYSR